MVDTPLIRIQISPHPFPLPRGERVGVRGFLLSLDIREQCLYLFGIHFFDKFGSSETSFSIG
jgi:hypothetical protein